ncbi:hypothetical protein OCK74_03555 [Chitinophagaceae bacterium LB-8]|uniref:Uncharacterized protein n=1 Tax=Paraflavisolibacter caeni TaxID=2982496 RepID=A0A9X2XSM8_9BACT|nr:hypothetical protein [Paraflavisolibacter caeni]MCU7548171.1 hypothetical protein [Paraflavisolibacter caeni]
MQHYFDPMTRVGMITSTVLTVWANIRSEDLLKTAILAAVGAVVSFLVSQVLKAVMRWIKR